MISFLNQMFNLYVLFPALLILGIYLSVRLRFLQWSKFFLGVRWVFQRHQKGQGNFSQAQAIASVLAGNCGTGNISGMAVALTTGGPGSLVWMWVMAFFGSIIQYASCLLAVKYRQTNASGEFVGGPMYYLSKGLRKPLIATLFAITVLLSAVSVGVFAQTNSMILAVAPFGCPTIIAMIGIMLASAGVVLGGARRLAQVSTAVIPIMAILYLSAALWILGSHITDLPAAVGTLFQAALSPKALMGGAFGYTLMQVITTGLGRALFATDVGTGYVPILQAGAKSAHPVIDGIVSLVAPFIVMVVCTVTGLVLMVTGAYETGLKSTQMVLYAFQKEIGQTSGLIVVSISLILFGYTTLIAWGCCFERAFEFLFKGKYRVVSLCFFLAMIPVGVFLNIDLVWICADITLTCMTLFNLIGVFGLANEVIEVSRSYVPKRLVKGV